MDNEDILICQEYCPNLKKVQQIKEEELSEEAIQKLSDTFKVLENPTRLRIINALANRELCVCDIAELLDMTQSAISHQLRKLKNMNLVKYRKEGRTVYYSLDDQHILQLFYQGLSHVVENKPE